MASCGSSSRFEVQFISEFRIVLVGNRGAGKTSLANVILHRQPVSPERTTRCVKIRGVAAGRLVTVVDTPGWWKNFPVSETPKVLKEELALSVTHCPPGPHAVLLVVRVDTAYKESARRAAQEHLELLGEHVWQHAMVVFTYGDGLQEQSIERHFGGEGEALLQGLVDRCGSRWHVLNIDRYSVTEVMSLLEGIEEMVSRNGGFPYEAAPERLHKVMEGRRAAEARASKMRTMVQEQRRIRQGRNCILPSLSMVLVGYRRAGKTSVQYTVFGKDSSGCKRTSQCVKTQGEVAGKLVTVVDTPGWWKALPVRDTPELDKREIFFGTVLCSPGVHALLLALRADMTFTEEDRKSVEEHMDLLGERVWNHTILLFTHADLLGDTAIEQYIESEGKDLKLLVAKCQNRYHVLDNMNLVNASQVTQLLEKIEEMVSENDGCCYEVNQKVCKQWRQKWRAVEKKAKMRRKINQRQAMNSMKGARQRLSKLSLVLLGYGESGKTSVGNTILGTAAFGSRRTSQCVRRSGTVAGRQLTVVDSPGWWKRRASDHMPQINKREIAQSVSLTLPGPVAFLLVVRLDASFQEEERRAAEDHLELLGEAVWERSMVLFSCEEWLGDRTVELHVEGEGKALKWLLKKCGGRFHVLSNRNRHGACTQVAELLEKVEELVRGDGVLKEGLLENRSGGEWPRKGGKHKQKEPASTNNALFAADMEDTVF